MNQIACVIYYFVDKTMKLFVGKNNNRNEISEVINISGKKIHVSKQMNMISPQLEYSFEYDDEEELKRIIWVIADKHDIDVRNIEGANFLFSECEWLI